MSRFIKWFLVSTAVVLMTACGGGGSSGDGATNDGATTNEPLAPKVTYTVNSDVVEYSKTDPIKRADEATTFIAPVSIGLSEGDVFVFENVAYKISMIAADEASDTIKIFTQLPTLDEVVEDLEISGTIPFSVPQVNTASSFKLKAKATNLKTNKTEAVTFTCNVPNNELKPEEVENGFTFGVTCEAVSGGATIKITSTETIIGGVLVEYEKGRSKKDNKIGFDIDINVVSTLSGNYKIEIDNDQAPNSLFRGVAFLGTTPVTVSVEYFFLAGVTFDGSATFTRTDNYNYKRLYNFDFEKIESHQDADSTNDLNASVTVGAHMGIRPMASIGVLGVDVVGLYVDTKIKETLSVSGELSQETANTCVTSKLDFTLQGGYKRIAGAYKPIGSEYVNNLRTDTTPGCMPFFLYNLLSPSSKVPANPYYTSSGSSNFKQIKNSDIPAIQYSSTDTSSDDLRSELVDADSYESIIQIDKTGIGDKTISKVTWEVVDGDMELEIASLESDGSRIKLSASDEQGSNATLSATITATDGTTLSQETSVSRNGKPVAIPKVYISGNDLVLDASSSYDPDGNPIIIYGWFFTDTGKRIINENPINKVPLSDLPNPVNLKMAVASDNQPIETSEIESVSFDINDAPIENYIPITSVMLNGKTFYERKGADCVDGEGYAKMSFSNGTSIRTELEQCPGESDTGGTFSFTYNLDNGFINTEAAAGKTFKLKEQNDKMWILDEDDTGRDYTKEERWYFSKPADFPENL